MAILGAGAEAIEAYIVCLQAPQTSLRWFAAESIAVSSIPCDTDRSLTTMLYEMVDDPTISAAATRAYAAVAGHNLSRDEQFRDTCNIISYFVEK